MIRFLSILLHGPHQYQDKFQIYQNQALMNFNFDIDEADVAVLSQNLARSKELFTNISKSLTQISSKAETASRKIKPVLSQVNRLNNNKSDIEAGLSLVENVQAYALRAADAEKTLNGSIESTGVTKYLTTVIQLKSLLKEMKSNVGQFKGVLVNFQNSIEKAEYMLVSYFKKLVIKHSSPVDLASAKRDEINTQIGTTATKDLTLILDYFHSVNPEDSTLDEIYTTSRADFLLKTMNLIESLAIPPKKVNKNAPYEKGSTKFHDYTDKVIRLLEAEAALLSSMNERIVGQKIDDSEYLFQIFAKPVNENYSEKVSSMIRYVEQNLTTDGLLSLELIGPLKRMERALYRLISHTGVTSNFKSFFTVFGLLKKLCQLLFMDLLVFTEKRISNMEKLPNDNGVSEVTVDLMLRVRKILEFRENCLDVIEGMKLGSWMMQSPPLRSVTVFSSVIQGENAPDDYDPKHLLSSYFSDCIDCITINLELLTRAGELKIAKKSVQGYFLMTNLTLIEQIINRLADLHKLLGTVGLERLSKLKKRFLVLFLDDWNYASYIIIRDMTSITATAAITQGTSGLLKAHTPTSKEKEQIKLLFKTFNELFEDAISNYKNFNINDQNLRQYLANEIKKLIMNTYFKLYDKYGTTDFTKNKSKYVKYDKKLFEDLLNRTL